MTAVKKETAEQKLLKMIEASAGPSQQASAKTQKKVSSKQSVTSVIKAINNILLVGVLFAIASVVNQVYAGVQLLSRDSQFDVPKDLSSGPDKSEASVPSTQRVSFYLAAVKQRNVFQPYTPPDVKNVVEVSERNALIAQKTRGLKLVGVSWLDSVESASVMIEDMENKTTYFLRTGEKVGDVVVKTIYADSVELSYQNEEIIIRYDKSQM